MDSVIITISLILVRENASNLLDTCSRTFFVAKSEIDSHKTNSNYNILSKKYLMLK